MTDVILKRFESPDGVRRMIKGKFEIVRLGGVTIGRATYHGNRRTRFRADHGCDGSMNRSSEAPPAAASAPAAASPSPSASGLVRGVGRWALVGLVINAIIGAGIFGLPSKIHALAGPYGLLAYLVCAVAIAGIALCTAEVSSRFTATGGPYLYAQRAFGPLAGFLIGWLMWVTRVTALAAIGNVLASYLSFFWAPAAAGWGRAMAMGAVMGALAWINLVGVGRAAATAGVFAVAKLVPLTLFVGVGIFFLDPRPFSGAIPPDATSFSRAVLQLIFAFVGFETVAVAAGESKDPRRDMPFALLVAIPVSTLLYALIQVVCIGTLPGLADSERPLADASVRFAGAWGGSVIALGALISTTGTLLVSMLVGPRVLFAMSEQDQMPRIFTRTHPRFHTPHAAILLTAAAGLALAISGTFTYLLSLSVIARLTAYLATAGALLVFRRRPEEAPALVSVPSGGLVATLTMGACLWLLTSSGVRELRDVGVALLAGLLLFGARRAWRARRAGAATGGSSRP